jgi:hypothetical protein
MAIDTALHIQASYIRLVAVQASDGAPIPILRMPDETETCRKIVFKRASLPQGR